MTTQTSPSSSSLTADVAIIGGGLVGATLAALLASAGFAVAVIDRAPPEAGLDGGFDGRASAIAQSTQGVLAAAGLWPALVDKAGPIEDIRVADGASRLFLHYDHREVGELPLGFMIENRHMRRALYDRLKALTPVRTVAPADVAGFRADAGGVEITLKNGGQIRAPLLVGADGRGSWVRQAAGIRLTGWPYKQTAIVCTVAHEAPHGFIAHEHFLPAGPFAILPIIGDPANPGHQSSLVWTEHAHLAPELLALDDRAFLEELALRFGDFLGPLSLVGPRWSHPLGLQYAETATAERLALVGDALHGMHPIAGQGLNMGLRDVAVLAEVLTDARRLGLDIGAADTLEKFERWRRFDNSLMLAMTDGLNRLFSNDIAPIRVARDLGLAAVNQMPGMKKFFMRHAMGTVGDLPRVMRGEAL